MRLSAVTAASFEPKIPFEDRTWFAWETLLWQSTQRPVLGIALLLCVVPLSILSVPLLPFVSLALLRPPPPPRGIYEVGTSDVQHRLTMDGNPILRLRVFYPAARAPWALRRKWSSRSWLAPDKSRGRYATRHAYALPLPSACLRFLAPYLGWVLRWARLPKRVLRGAPPAPSATCPEAGTGWPLVVFSHGLYGCAAGYTGLCAEVASHGSIVVAVEHKDGSAIYTETDDGDRRSYEAPEDDHAGRDRQQSRRAAEVRAVIASIDDVIAKLTDADGGLSVDSSAVTLIGHSFGASTALRVAADLRGGPTRVRAVVASDPWISGYNVTRHGAATVPTLALLTQSMMCALSVSPCTCTARVYCVHALHAACPVRMSGVHTCPVCTS